MISSWYNAGIKIAAVEGKQLANATDLPLAQAQAFIQKIRNALDELAILPLGAELLEELRTSNKKCTIFSSDAAYYGAGPVCVMDPQTVEADAARRIKPFRAPQASFVKALNQWQSKAPSNEAMKKRGGFLSKRGRGGPSSVMQPPPRLMVPGEPRSNMSSNVYSRELNRIITASNMDRKMVATLAGVSLYELTQMEEGTLEVSNDVYIKLAMLLYPFLTPGPGSDSAIRFASIDDEPDFIILGHELIHGWRMMKGMRITDRNAFSWEEEAMTTGIPPFTNFKYTENKLRIQLCGSPLRRNYPGAQPMSSMAMDANQGCQVRKEDPH